MQFNKQNVMTVVTADDISQRVILAGIYGYFAYDIDSLQKAVTAGRTSSRCMYGRLTKVMDSTNRSRFVLDNGNYIFSLFYPTDNYLNTDRYQEETKHCHYEDNAYYSDIAVCKENKDEV